MKYCVTGNEYVSLPTIRETDGVLEGVSFLYMQRKGMLELYGDDGLIAPFFRVNGEEARVSPEWEYLHSWVPSFHFEDQGAVFSCRYLAPIGQRGFILHMEAVNRGMAEVSLGVGVNGNWAKTLHTVNESIELAEGKCVKPSGWNGMFVYYQCPGTPLFAFAPILEDHQAYSEFTQDADWRCDGFSFRIQKEKRLTPGESMTLDLIFGIGFEEVSAATSAKEMLRQGYLSLLGETCAWLAAREKHLPDGPLSDILNRNLFFSFFYATGRTLDTEELCMVTSRSPRYYVSAAYWDRDSLLWAFPAICETDAEYARELLVSVFTRQARNFGVHSRYIDGTVLEPGFELDELCAPVIALKRYIVLTGDAGILEEACIRPALLSIERKLNGCKHPDADLYRTFLQPTDDLHNYPYLTYNNVLVWYALNALSAYLNDPALAVRAEMVKRAIWEFCVKTVNGKRMFIWSADLAGSYDVYDEPPGSLQLLPFYGFCGYDDEVWLNTMESIRSKDYPLSFAGCNIAEIGCKHAAHPWVLSICNSLLSGHADSAVKHLRRTALDNGIACESVDETTGECTTGCAFATCAGFLAFALLHTFGSNGLK